MTATTYAYKVRDKGGKLVEGSLDADNEQLLVAKLRSMGYTPIGVTAQKSETLGKELHIPGRTGIKVKDVAVFSRQFATRTRRSRW
jgi:type IV pilus assembly protein PilC